MKAPRQISLLIIFILAIASASCINKKKESEEQVQFSIRKIPLKVDTTIHSIAYQGDYLLCLQNNGKIAILDTSYNRMDSLEKNVSSFKFDFLFKYHDTLFVGNKTSEYYLSQTFLPIIYKIKRKVYGDVFHEDSAYLIYGCCFGEFGGSIFFLNKSSGKTYSYFATCPGQVLRSNQDYIVCNNLAHMADHMSFLIVKNPITLYELTDENFKNHCNWYTTIDSLREYWQVSKVGDIRFYDAYDAMSLVTFPFKDSLYSVISTDNATLVVVHRGDTTITKDTLVNQRIAFHESQVVESGSRKACLYKLTGGSPVAAYWLRGNNTGLIIVNNNRIDFLEKAKIPKL